MIELKKWKGKLIEHHLIHYSPICDLKPEDRQISTQQNNTRRFFSIVKFYILHLNLTLSFFFVYVVCYHFHCPLYLLEPAMYFLPIYYAPFIKRCMLLLVYITWLEFS